MAKRRGKIASGRAHVGEKVCRENVRIHGKVHRGTICFTVRPGASKKANRKRRK